MGQKAFDHKRVAGSKLGTVKVIMTGTLTLDPDMPSAILLDPGGAIRDLRLPLADLAIEGLEFWIAHGGGAFDITVKDSTGVTTYGTLSTTEMAKVILMDQVWRISVGTTT